MIVLESLVTLDVAAVIIMVILSFLSKQLGSALKIPPFYRILYVNVSLLVVAAGIDSIRTVIHMPSLATITMLLRAVSGCTAIVICLPYWKWLFSEYFKKEG